MALSSSVTYTAVHTVAPLHAQALEAPLQMPVEATTTAKYDPLASNCYLYVRSKILTFPLTKDLVPNSPVPIPGGVVILDYNGTPHYALTPYEYTKEGVFLDESNFKKGTYTQRFVDWEYLKNHNAKYWYQI